MAIIFNIKYFIVGLCLYCFLHYFTCVHTLFFRHLSRNYTVSPNFQTAVKHPHHLFAVLQTIRLHPGLSGAIRKAWNLHCQELINSCLTVTAHTLTFISTYPTSFFVLLFLNDTLLKKKQQHIYTFILSHLPPSFIYFPPSLIPAVFLLIKFDKHS